MFFFLGYTVQDVSRLKLGLFFRGTPTWMVFYGSENTIDDLEVPPF